MSLRDDVERWLVHEGYSYRSAAGDDETFKLVIKHVGGFGSRAEIFEPKKQPGVLVIGTMTPLNNSQNARYLGLGQERQKEFDGRIAEYCRSIRAVHRMQTENGRKMIGTYIVLEDQINHTTFSDSLQQAAQMGDMVTRYLIKTF